MPNFVTKPIPADKPDVDKPDADKPDADHVERPWGSFKQYAFHEATTVSLMTVKPGRRLSLQSHTGRAELWFVLDDGALVQVDDWMRLDPDGRPRALNIERAFANLYFDRKRVRMAREFASHPIVPAEGDGLRLEHLPTHAEHFYDAHRMTLQPHARATINTNGSVHILSLVDGPTVSLTTAKGMTQTFSYIETFVVSAAAGEYQLHNPNDEPIMVVTAFVKAGDDFP